MDNKMAPVHPGEIPAKEFLNPMGISQHRLAISIGVPPRLINEIGKDALGDELDKIQPLGSVA